MSKIKIDHIAVVVKDMDNALSFWRDALGLPLGGTESVEDEEVEVAFLPAGESRIELLYPTSADSGIAQYLEKRGAGMHHLCLAVADIEDSMEQLAQHGVQLINETPRHREDGTRYAFIHPKSTGGVLVELYEVTETTS
jgi:methylmalonyl-CoA/ethylmalonyl-CoA epimerase